MNTLYLKTHGPFYKYLIAYQSIGIGLANIVNRESRSLFNPEEVISYGSKTGDDIFQHMNEILVSYDQILDRDDLSELLGCMFINICYETVKEYNDKSPEYEFFRHVRNAASHNNTFCFARKEPYLAAEWRGIVIETDLKGQKNPLQGKKCLGNIIGSADMLYLISDIEKRIPDEFYECEICRKTKCK